MVLAPPLRDRLHGLAFEGEPDLALRLVRSQHVPESTEGLVLLHRLPELPGQAVSTLPMALPFINDGGKSMPMRQREDWLFPSAAGIDVCASSHWVAVLSHRTDAPVRGLGTMTDDLNGLADSLIACGMEAHLVSQRGRRMSA
ncbi:hypothetical protein [Pelomonas cellulosilytica]|uniref:hypothetical protein n=1 Tax=Pelomonas cellulosilytica TaxID=2906762 RepID=UPI003B02CBBC